MNTGLISSRYALAFIDFAQEGNASDSIYLEVKNLLKSFSLYKELNNMLHNPILSQSQKHETIRIAMGGSVHPMFDKFLTLILENKREKQLQFIALKFIELYRERNNIFSAKLISAVEVDAATEQKLITMVKNEKNVRLELEKEIDPNILGGFIFEMDSLRWDGSISSQLRRMRKNFADKNKRIVS